MAGFSRRRRAPGATQQDGDGRDSTGVAPARLTDAQIAASRPCATATAVEYGISMLAVRSLPEKKLREKIRTRYSEEETDAGLSRLRELRLVDDESWAERYVRDRFERLGKGRHRIRMELLGKGIDAATADAALDRVVGGDDERAKAAAMLDAMRGRLARSPGASRSGLPGPVADAVGDAGGDGPADAPESSDAAPDDGPPVDPRERRQAAERLKNRLFRRMLARGFPASVVRDLLDVS